MSLRSQNFQFPQPWKSGSALNHIGLVPCRTEGPEQLTRRRRSFYNSEYRQFRIQLRFERLDLRPKTLRGRCEVCWPLDARFALRLPPYVGVADDPFRNVPGPSGDFKPNPEESRAGLMYRARDRERAVRISRDRLAERPRSGKGSGSRTCRSPRAPRRNCRQVPHAPARRETSISDAVSSEDATANECAPREESMRCVRARSRTIFVAHQPGYNKLICHRTDKGKTSPIATLAVVTTSVTPPALLARTPLYVARRWLYFRSAICRGARDVLVEKSASRSFPDDAALRRRLETEAKSSSHRGTSARRGTRTARSLSAFLPVP